jgi:hypothetical protein
MVLTRREVEELLYRAEQARTKLLDYSRDIEASLTKPKYTVRASRPNLPAAEPDDDET